MKTSKFFKLKGKIRGGHCNNRDSKGLNWELNPGPLAPKARIIPLDH